MSPIRCRPPWPRATAGRPQLAAVRGVTRGRRRSARAGGAVSRRSSSPRFSNGNTCPTPGSASALGALRPGLHHGARPRGAEPGEGPCVLRGEGHHLAPAAGTPAGAPAQAMSSSPPARVARSSGPSEGSGFQRRRRRSRGRDLRGIRASTLGHSGHWSAGGRYVRCLPVRRRPPPTPRSVRPGGFRRGPALGKSRQVLARAPPGTVSVSSKYRMFAPVGEAGAGDRGHRRRGVAAADDAGHGVPSGRWGPAVRGPGRAGAGRAPGSGPAGAGRRAAGRPRWQRPLLPARRAAGPG